jgi:transposase InsO family protein
VGTHDGSVSKQHKYPSTLLFIKIMINGTKIRAMVDTGATVSLIKLSTLKQVNYQHHINRTGEEITLGDGKTKLWQYGWVDLCVKINFIKTKVRAIVADDLAADFILGMDWIKFYDVHILPGKQHLKIHHGQQQTTILFDEDAEIEVKLVQQYNILPHANCIVKVKASIINASHLYFCGLHQHSQQQKGISVIDGLVTVNNNIVKLNVTNISNHPVTLQKDMKIGTISRLSMNTYVCNLQPTIVENQSGHSEKVNNMSEQAKEIIKILTNHLTDFSEHSAITSVLAKHSALFETKNRKVITPIHHIIDTGNHPPISTRPYFKTIQQRKDIQQEIDKMLKSGIIIPSHSPWSSPVILLKKPNGDFRFIVDYRKLNAITRKDSYPQPKTEDLLQQLGGHKWFTKLDLKSGYFQLPIQDCDKAKTAFCTQDGLYQFEVLSMGLMNAPPTFQRVMNNIIGYKRWDFVLVYLDDIVIFSNSFEEHMEHLDEILSTLNQHHFQLNEKKCIIAVQQVEFLSHIITCDSIQPSKDRIQAILDMPEPRTLAQANRFIGKIGWYRKFIPQFAEVAAAIHKVTNKTKKMKHEFYWHQEQCASFNNLKNILTTPPLMLKYPHPTAEFILATDASEYAIGGALKQEIDGKTHYNYYLSRLLSPTEKKYKTIEREALAIFWCMSKLQQYLGGRDVTILTDHKPLEQFQKKNHMNCKRVEEWLLKYQDIIPQMIDVKYKKGCLHGDADGFSRPEPCEQIDESSCPTENHLALNAITRSMSRKIATTNHHDISSTSTAQSQLNKLPPMTFDFGIERIREEQNKDADAQLIMKNIQQESSYIIDNRVLYKIDSRSCTRTNRKLIYIPSSMRSEVLTSYHDHPTAAHFGLKRTWEKLRRRCYWPKMRAEIENYIASCDKCARYNIKRTKKPGKLNPIIPPEGPMELIGMDFWGPTRQESVNGNKYVLVITDYMTKFVVAKALPNNTAQITAQTFLEEFIFKFGVPNRLITDQGVHFNNELMKNMAELLGFNHIKSTPYHPQTNGQVERFNATFRPQLAKLFDENLGNWDEYLPAVVYAYNTGQHATTGYSPFQLMFGRQPTLPLAEKHAIFTLTKPSDYWPRMIRSLKMYHQAARQNIQVQQHLAKTRFDLNRSDPIYKTNDLVLWRKPCRVSKLEERYSGPHIIIQEKHPTYIIQERETLIQRMVHVADLQPILERYV